MNIENEELEWIEIQLKNNPTISIENTGWNHPQFAELKEKDMNFDLYIQTPPEVAEGVLLCKRCKSKKVLSFQTQTRSADEPMTTVAKCLTLVQNGQKIINFKQFF